MANEFWLALMIGNSRSHWALFCNDVLHQTWDTPHFSPETIQQLIGNPSNLLLHLSPSSPSPLPSPSSPPLSPSSPPLSLWLASVVPAQSERWKAYPLAHCITLEQVPLAQMYPTLGVDRALAVWGAIAIVGSPVLVIDAGTACTFTGADAQNRLFGGAILPGLRLQLQSLKQGTAALPRVDLAQHHSNVLPPRWAMDTQAAIASGILYTLVAGILDFMSDWWQQFPNSPVIMTGGDRQLLHSILIDQFPDLAGKLTLDSNLIFWGMRSVKQKIETNC